ncbi:MAG: hypothetical protein FWF03_03680, partial [Defluviitaleaceae bacterium]|nr:hypothetical protein [Defluviitaleaceae bacterium]
MRYVKKLQKEWAVSIVPGDAAKLADGLAVDETYACAGDDENAPAIIDLPGGASIGKRSVVLGPRSLPESVGEARAKEINEFFADKVSGEDGKRFPNSFLSYAKTVEIPPELEGSDIYLTVDQARYHVSVSVNGKRAAHYLGGLEPHRVDITELVTPGGKAEILITAGDVGVSGYRVFDPYNYTGTRLPRCDEIKNNHVHPVHYGGADRAVGYVTVEAVPAVRVDYVFADPKVSRGLLQYTVTLCNDTDTEANIRLFSEAAGAKVLAE